ncbi:hypothetical protein CXB51_028563 [Gossypium anomalum]|uniref:Zinc knuckle CX2CX4HX4C domain-containing protein n=1 Tax=Gossypium anomalum TaxID=47600 RepID=A0A8J5Y7D9_9ROSI|nr:hypothetical protein CXB51_028563 [Gossypium anomalum]
MAEDINEMLGRLTFFEEESKRVIRLDYKGYEAWAVGKIMSDEKIKKEAMYRVLKPLWFTKEEVSFVALNEGFILGKFGSVEDRLRILNMRWEGQSEKSRKSIGEIGRDAGWTSLDRHNKTSPKGGLLSEGEEKEIVCAIKYERLPIFCYLCGIVGHTTQKCVKQTEDGEQGSNRFQYGNWLRVQLIGNRQNRENLRNGVKIIEEVMGLKEKEKIKGGVEDSESVSTIKKCHTRHMRDGGGKTELKLFGENLWIISHLVRRWLATSPAKNQEPLMLELFGTLSNSSLLMTQMLSFYANKVARVRDQCRLDGCLAVNVAVKSGGLAMLWKEGTKVDIQNYSKYHIDSVVQLKDQRRVRFTGFYGDANLNQRNELWNMLKRVGGTVNEIWIVGGDFNAIANNAEKEGGHRKSKALMDDFCNTIRGWYTWVNNREGSAMVKERFDRFMILANDVANFPYIETKVVRQSTSDHDAITLDTMGGLNFKYEAYWANDRKAKEVKQHAWKNSNIDVLNHNKRMKIQIEKLKARVNNIIDGPYKDNNMSELKETRRKLGQLLYKEECYWAQRSRIRWLKERDQNTRFFHVRAMSRKKKNHIEKLIDANGCWKYTTTNICNIAIEYFQNLFTTSNPFYEENSFNLIKNCITGEMNCRLTKDFTDNV